MYNKGGAGQKLKKSCMFCWNTRFWNQWIKGQLKAFEKASEESLDPLNEAFLKSVNRRCSCMLSKDANSTDVIQSHNIWYLSLPLCLPLLLICHLIIPVLDAFTTSTSGCWGQQRGISLSESNPADLQVCQSNLPVNPIPAIYLSNRPHLWLRYLFESIFATVAKDDTTSQSTISHNICKKSTTILWY